MKVELCVYYIVSFHPQNTLVMQLVRKVMNPNIGLALTSLLLMRLWKFP